MKNRAGELDKELCKSNAEQLFKEVVNDIFDHRMNPDDEGKHKTSKGIPWLIGTLKEKSKIVKSASDSRGQKNQKP